MWHIYRKPVPDTAVERYRSCGASRTTRAHTAGDTMQCSTTTMVGINSPVCYLHQYLPKCGGERTRQPMVCSVLMFREVLNYLGYVKHENGPRQAPTNGVPLGVELL